MSNSRITEEWVDQLSQLSAFKAQKLYKVVAPFILGIELIKLPIADEYRPHMVWYPLWKADVDRCLDEPIILKEYLDDKGLQISIPYSAQDAAKTRSAIGLVAKADPLLLSGKAELTSVIHYFDQNAKDILVRAHAGKLARNWEAKLTAYSYYNQKDLLKEGFGQLWEESENWNMNLFEVWYGDFSSWLQQLKVKLDDWHALNEVVETNSSSSGLNVTEVSVI